MIVCAAFGSTDYICWQSFIVLRGSQSNAISSVFAISALSLEVFTAVWLRILFFSDMTLSMGNWIQTF